MSKKLIPLLLMLVMLFSLVTEAHASGNIVEVKSGSTTAKVTFTISNVLAFEGTVSTSDSVGFKVKKITGPTEKDGTIVRMSADCTQIVVIGKSTPQDIKLTVELESSSPMQNGIYPVQLSYGVTSPYGTYGSNGRMYSYIYVGVKAPKEDGSTSSNSSTTTKPTQQKPTEPEVTVTEQGEGADRVDVMGMLDTTALRSALEEAEKMKTYGNLNAADLKRLQEAIDAGEEALLGDRQAVVDDAAFALMELIKELGGPIDIPSDEGGRERPSRSGGLLLPLILAIVAVLGIAGVLTYLYLKKKKHVGYDGAPIVDYEISDDDEM